MKLQPATFSLLLLLLDSLIQMHVTPRHIDKGAASSLESQDTGSAASGAIFYAILLSTAFLGPLHTI